MAPITKNIMVVDEHGNRYEATYLRRAKGLVKAGRARFIDDGTLCLARPPNRTEDANMSGIFAPKDAEGIAPNVDIKEVVRDYLGSAAQQPEAKADVPAGLSMEQILSRIDAVIQDSQYIKELFANLGSHHEGDVGAMAVGMGNAVEAREKTNQRLLDLLGRMYDDLAGRGERTLSEEERKAQERRDDFIAMRGDEPLSSGALAILIDRVYGDKYPARNV